MKVSERAINLTRIFNLREGFRAEDDGLPARFFKPKNSGALSDTAVDPQELSEAKGTYYTMMGWDEEGAPTGARLEELGIGWAADYRNSG
ncbi:hypothetical protein GWN63_02635 [Candidatus Bathyarchaeota archaeon]|nr:hypothetical protein [Desulfobacterales bacterium]NIU81127.1 hypothetical protein [Candidatus Bathyarchaeota archaeon]NIV67760.1 hypothetical protein [Candidatus Bathyarchaeota archaeon]